MHCRHQRQRKNQNHQRDDHDEHHHKLWLQHPILILGQDPKAAATAALVKPNYYSSHHRPIAEEGEESDANNILLDCLRSSSSHGSLSLRSLNSSNTSTGLCSSSLVRSLSHNCNSNNSNMSYFTKHYNNNNNNNNNNVNLANDTFSILTPSKIQVQATAVVGSSSNNNNIFNRMVEIDSSGLGPYALTTTSTGAATKNVVRNSNNNMNLLSTLRGDAAAESAASSSCGSSSNNNNNNNTNYGPSLLFRLIAIPPPNEPLPWDIILQRAKSHPHEACVYDSNAGGHVYALHRLLRRTGDHSTSGTSSSGSGSGGRYCYRPPLSVVEAVMQACPRAVTRKQAMIDEDELLLLLDDDKIASLTNTTIHTDDDNNNNSMTWKSTSSSSVPPPNDAQLLNFVKGATLPLLPPNNNNNNNNAGMHPRIHINNGQQQQQHNHPPHQGRANNTTIGYRHRPSGDDTAADHDDVRYEYPLAIACEYEQSGEIIRLLASSISKTKPAYRSEVFRSLDFVSLPNFMVRILLEEYAGCVLERGVNSEATEGDDDDCPLEQVLFWWDDPDMVGIEEAILKYPNCSMKNDLWNLWEKLSMMLYAASTGTMKGYDESKESFKVLHHVLRIASDGGIQDVRFPNDVTHALLLLAKFIQREQISMFRERDESGSFPIHIAVSGSGLFRQNSNDSHYMDSAGWNGEMVDEGNDQESVRQNRNNADEEREVEGDVFQAHGGEAADAGVGAHVLNGEQQRGPPAVVQRQEEDGEGEEEDEEDDNDEEGDDDDDDIDTSTGSMDIIRLLLDQYPASIRLRDSQSGSLPVHLALQHNPYATNVIEHLLDRFPRSAMMPDGNGRLAIHLALIHKSPTWKMILSLSPAALEARDPVTGLLPFQLAAMAKPVSHDVVTQVVNKASDDQSEHDLLSTCFYLLRMSPCLASGLADIEPPRRSSIQQQIMFRCKPRVTKLEEENERLRRRVDELELKLRLMEMGESSTTATTTCPHHVKKRKSSLREY